MQKQRNMDCPYLVQHFPIMDCPYLYIGHFDKGGGGVLSANQNKGI